MNAAVLARVLAPATLFIMKTCQSCAAPVARFDASCSFCDAVNPERDLMAAEVLGLIARGQQAVNERRPGEVVELLARAVALEPEAFDAHFQMTLAWHQLGNLERAVECLERAKRVRSGNAPIYYNIGMMTAQIGERYRARWHLWEALRLATLKPSMARNEEFFATMYRELARLGPITNDELASIQPQRDADSCPHNPELSAMLAELAGGTTPSRTLRLRRLRSLVRARSRRRRVSGRPRQSTGAAPRHAHRSRWEQLGPRVLGLRRCGRLSPARAAAGPGALSDRAGADGHQNQGPSILVNPRANGGGVPIPRTAVEVIAQGSIPQIRITEAG